MSLFQFEYIKPGQVACLTWERANAGLAKTNRLLAMTPRRHCD